jgi:hypothetical protein
MIYATMGTLAILMYLKRVCMGKLSERDGIEAADSRWRDQYRRVKSSSSESY